MLLTPERVWRTIGWRGKYDQNSGRLAQAKAFGATKISGGLFKS
jgi:hypothetical protein